MAKINSLPLNKIKQSPRFVEKKDGINITRVIFPHDVQVGLADSEFQSNLTVKGEIKGHVHQTAGGISYLVAGTGITITSGSNGQITINGQVGDITSVVAGSGLTGGATTGDATLNIGAGTGITVNADDIEVDADGATLTTSNSHLDHFLINDGGAFKRIAPGNVNISGLNNDSGFTTTNGTVTNVTVGTGLDVTNGTTTPNISLDLSELTDMTADVVGSSDELILLDSSAERRKLISEIKLGQFNNDQGWTSNAGDITGVSAGNGLTGGGTSGDVTLNIGAAQTTITSLFATDIKIGEDDQTKIDFGTPNEINFACNNQFQIKLKDGVLHPTSDSDVDLGLSGNRFKDAYVDSVTVTGDVSVGGTLSTIGGMLEPTSVEIDTGSTQGNAGNANYWIKVAECDSDSDDKGQATIHINLEGRSTDARCSGIVYLRHGGNNSSRYDISVDLVSPPNTPNTQDNTDFVLTYDSSSTYKSQLWVRSNETYQKCYATIIDGTKQPNEQYVNFYQLTPGSSWAASITSLGSDLTATYTDRTFNNVTTKGTLTSEGLLSSPTARITSDSGVHTPQLHIHEDDSDDYARIAFTNTADTSGGIGDYSHEWALAGLAATETNPGSAKFNIYYGDADGDGTGADILTVTGDKKVGINDNTPSYSLDVNGDIRVTDDLFVDDFARIDALRVGTTSTDPGDGNLYVEGDVTVAGGNLLGPTDDTLFIKSDHNINVILDNDNDSTRYFLVGNHAGTYKYVISEEGKINQGDSSVPKNSYTLRHTNADGDNGLLLVNNNATVSSGDFLGGVGFDSADGNVPSSILEASAYIGAIAAENHGTGDKGGHLVFGNSPINQNDDTTSTENMRISSAGNVTAPNNCFVSAYLSSDQSNIAHSTDVTVVFNAETYDTQGAFNTSNGVFTAPADGKYHITAQLRVDNLDSAASYVRTVINTGGSHDVANYFDIDAIANSDPSFSGLFIDTIVHLDANDTAVIQVRQEGGAAQADINGSTAGSSNASRVQIRLVQ